MPLVIVDEQASLFVAHTAFQHTDWPFQVERLCWEEVTFPFHSLFSTIVNENCDVFVVHAHVCQVNIVIQQRQFQYLQVNYVDWAVHSPDAESEADVVANRAWNSGHKTTVFEKYFEHLEAVRYL